MRTVKDYISEAQKNRAFPATINWLMRWVLHRQRYQRFINQKIYPQMKP